MKKMKTAMAMMLATVAMLLAACSDDSPGSGKGAGAAGDSLFVRLRIAEADATAGTRADEAGPTAAERQIYDGILCIFVGQSEAVAELKAACVVDQLIGAEDETTNATAFVQRLPSEKLDRSVWSYFVDDGGGNNANKLYALLLLNTSHTGLRVSDGTLYNGKSEDLTGKTIADMQALALTSIGSTDRHTGLFMSNTPRKGGGVLTEITNLYSSWNAANAASATPITIYVERAAAKVQVSTDAGTGIGFTLNGSSIKAQLHRLTWTPDNTMTSYYAVRNTSGWEWTDFPAADYVRDGNWATSPNYTGGATLSNISGSPFSVYRQQALADGTPAYVMENTTNAANTVRERLTRVIVEVQLKDASSVLLGDCFAFGGVSTTLYTGADQLVTAMKTWWDGGFGNLGHPRNTYVHLREKTAEELFLAPTVAINDDYTVTLTLQNSTFDVSEAAELGQLANELSALTVGYREGRMYYSASIQHKATGTCSYEVLGDYGVVRSNFYQLTLGNVTTVGSPTPVLPFLVPAAMRLYIVDWKSGGSFPLSPT